MMVAVAMATSASGTHRRPRANPKPMPNSPPLIPEADSPAIIYSSSRCRFLLPRLQLEISGSKDLRRVVVERLTRSSEAHRDQPE